MTYTSISVDLGKTEQYIDLISCRNKQRHHRNMVKNRMDEFEAKWDIKVGKMSRQKIVQYDLMEVANLQYLDAEQAKAEFL